MSREEIEKLLGGYATGTLSDTERQRLFEAALEDQEIFALLAREQDFKDLLETPGAREELLAALASEPVLAAAAPAAARHAPEPEKAGFWSWLTQPWPWAVAATAAFTAVLFFALRPQPAPVETAAVVRPEPMRQEQELMRPPEPPKPVERAAAPEPKPASGAVGAVRAQLPAVLPAAPPPPAVMSADREVREEAKKAVAIASAEKAAEKGKVDAPRPAEADRKTEATAVSAIAPPTPRKEMPPGATVQPSLRDDIARAGAPAPQLAKANEAAPALRYRLATPAFQAGREAEIFVTAAREGVLVVQRRAGEGWERILALRVRENQETRVSVPTRESDREVELDLSLTDAVSLNSSAGFRRADRPETPPGLRVRIPRAQ